MSTCIRIDNFFNLTNLQSDHFFDNHLNQMFFSIRGWILPLQFKEIRHLKIQDPPVLLLLLLQIPKHLHRRFKDGIPVYLLLQIQWTSNIPLLYSSMNDDGKWYHKLQLGTTSFYDQLSTNHAIAATCGTIISWDIVIRSWWFHYRYIVDIIFDENSKNVRNFENASFSSY